MAHYFPLLVILDITWVQLDLDPIHQHFVQIQEIGLTILPDAQKVKLYFTIPP